MNHQNHHEQQHHELHHEWKLIVDNESYNWHEDSITGRQIRELASVPDGVQVWKKNKGNPDSLVELETVIDLTQPGIERFSLQEASSGAGLAWRF
ncbi:MAG: multiubiquitin domain-containing protein [Methylobacter sp.]|jgi:hypothetical protein